MLSVFKRELKAFFTGYRGYVFLIIFLVGFCIVKMVYNGMQVNPIDLVLTDAEYGSIYTLTGFGYMLSYLPIAFVLAVPLLTFGMFSSEREGGAMSFLRSLPFNSRDIFFGKYFAIISVFSVSFAFLSAVGFILGFYNDADVASVLLGLLFYIIVCHTVTVIDILIAVLCKNKFLSFGVSYGINLMFVILFAVRYAIPYTVGGAFDYLSLIGSYTPYMLGIIDLSALCLQVSISAFALYLAYKLSKREIML